MRRVSTWLPGCLALSVVMVSGMRTQAASPDVDMPMRIDPPLTEPPPVVLFDKRLLGMWLEALGRPEADLRQSAAEALAEAAVRGMPEVREKAGPTLLKLLRQGDQPLTVRKACVRALVAAQYDEAAEALLKETAGDDAELILKADAALVAWDYAPARKVWLERAGDEKQSRMGRISAIEALARVGEKSLPAKARGLAINRQQPIGLRIAAAKAIAVMEAGTGRDAAIVLGTGKTPLEDQLVAVHLLCGANDQEAKGLLVKLAREGDPAVQAMAIGRLAAVAPELVREFNGVMMSHRDAQVRLAGVRALQAQKTAEGVGALMRLAGDADGEVRAVAVKALVACDAVPELQEMVRDQLLAALAGGNVDALEGAAQVAGLVREKRAARTLTKLLNASSANVRIAATVALRRIGEADAGGPLLDRAKVLTGQIRTMAHGGDQTINRAEANQELMEIVQSLGVLGHKEAAPVLLEMVGKREPFSGAVREAACWSLGKLSDAKGMPRVVAELAGRLADEDVRNPEVDEVRAAAAVALGRMKVTSHVGTLKRVAGLPSTPRQVQRGIRWAIHELTGTWPPEIAPKEIQAADWFLEPR